MTAAQLEQKALRLQAIIEEHTLQAHGMVPTLVRRDDYQLPTAEDYVGMEPHRHLQGKSEAELGLPPMHVWRAWENTSADTAFYLGAASRKYRCTQDAADLAVARRTFRALKHIYDIGAEFDEPGFLTKPYGGVASTQTSGDQLQCVTMGLEAFRDLADADEAAIMDEMFVGFADYLIRHQYRPKPGGYFAVTWGPWDWDNAGWGHVLIYVPVLLRAWQATGESRYREQVDRLYHACRNDTRYTSERRYTFGCAHRMLYLPALMMELEPEREAKWREIMTGEFRTISPGILDDGTSYMSVAIDPDSGEVSPVKTAWGLAVRTGRYTIFGWGCVYTQHCLPNEDMVRVAKRILENQDLDTFHFIMPADPDDELPSNWRLEGELLDHDSLVGWLVMYWEGRWRGYW